MKCRRLVIDFASVMANSVHSVARQDKSYMQGNTRRPPLPLNLVPTTEKFHFSHRQQEM